MLNRHLLLLGVTASVLTLGAGPAEAGVLIADDFESGNLSKWDMAVALASVVPSPVHGGQKALHIPYDLPAGDPTKSGSADNNRFVQSNMAKYDVHAFYVSGCFYLKSNTPDKMVSARKLYYIHSWSSDPRWDVVVSANGGETGGPMGIRIGSNAHEYSDLRVGADVTTNIYYDRWHCMRLEVKLNTPGQKNGYMRFYLDGVKQTFTQRGKTGLVTYENISIRNDMKPLEMVRIGAQINRSVGDYAAKHEDRYWDDIEVGTLDGSTPMPSPPSRPKAPSDVTVK